MKVVILCGGQGTRLREETEYRPKPLVDIGGRPILWHIMKMYAHHGLRDFVLCLGYKGNSIKEYFLNYEAMNNDFTMCLGRLHQVAYHGAHHEQDFRVTLADTGLDTMTGGRVKRVGKYIDDDDDTFMVTYGDGVADVDVRKLLVFNRGILDYLDGDDCILEREPLERLAAEEQLMAYQHHGFFFAMDTYREYKFLNDLWASGKAPWKVWS